MRLHSIINTIENCFVHVPEKAAWLADYLHELTTFPNGRYDDQADSTSQALEWIKDRTMLLAFDIWLHNDYRKKLTDQGRLEELSQYDEKCGMGVTNAASAYHAQQRSNLRMAFSLTVTPEGKSSTTALGGQSKVSRALVSSPVMSAQNLCFIQSVLLSVPAE